MFKRGNDDADIFAKEGADTRKPAFRVAKTVVACASLAKQEARWAAEATSCSGSGAGTTPGLQCRDHGYGRRERDSSESGTRRLPPPAAGQVSYWLSPIVASRFSQDSHLDPRTFRGHSLQLGRVFDSGGRALDRATIFCAKCGAVHWERADALCRSCRELPRAAWRANFAAAQVEVRALSEQTLSWLDCGRRSSALPGRGNHTGGAVGIVRGGVGSHSDGANHTQKATGCPAGSSAGTLGTHLQSCQVRGLGLAALGPGSAGFTGDVWAQRSAGGEARLQGRGFSSSQDRLKGWQHTRCSNSLRSTAQARPWRHVYFELRWIFRL